MLRPASFFWQKLTVAFLLALSVTFISPVVSGAQSSGGDITILEGGNIWIEGTAGPVDFTCNAEELSGKGEIETPSNPISTVTNEDRISLSVALPAESLNCGKRAMNRDMNNALRAEEFPFISYSLLEASLEEESSEAQNGEWMTIRTRGIMEIAGVQDTTTVMVQGQIENNQFRVKGTKDIHMDTYDIDPPSKMFGLVRTSKDLRVHFDVTVALSDTVASLGR